MLRRLSQVAAGDANAELFLRAQFRQRAQGAGEIERIVKIRNHYSGAEANRYAGGDRAQNDQLTAVAEVLVEPKLLEAMIGGQLGQANQLRHAVVIRQMRDELEPELAVEDGHPSSP